MISDKHLFIFLLHKKEEQMNIQTKHKGKVTTMLVYYDFLLAFIYHKRFELFVEKSEMINDIRRKSGFLLR